MTATSASSPQTTESFAVRTVILSVWSMLDIFGLVVHELAKPEAYSIGFLFDERCKDTSEVRNEHKG